MDRSTYRRCPLCSGAMTHKFTTTDLARPDCRDEYAVVWCDGCGFGMVAESFTPDQISNFYRIPYYTRSEQKVADRSFIDRAIIHLAWRLDQGRDLHPSDLVYGSSVCDIGCGGGGNMQLLRDAGFTVCGVDPDPIALSCASAYGRTILGSAEELPPELAGEQFDGVIMMHALEHCIDPKRALSNVASLLRPNGTAIIEVPNNACSGFNRLGGKWPFSDVPRHLHFFTPASLCKMAKECGLDVTEVKFTGYVRQFFPEWVARTGQNRLAQILRTGLLPDAKKYDSVRIEARRSESAKPSPAVQRNV